MKRAYLLFLAGAMSLGAQAQLSISNADFELFSSCPTTLGQVPRATDWFDVVMNADYYNCSFTSYPSYPATTPLAASGTGFMGFASYGNPVGAAEAIGQHLATPLLPGVYTIKLASKKASGGTYGNDCGGVAIYGFKDALGPVYTGVHISTIPGAMLLGATPMVTNTVWQTYTVSLSVADTIRDIVFTVEKAPSCATCLFLDQLSAGQQQPSGLPASGNASWLNIYPNPSAGTVYVQSGRDADAIVVTDITGRVLLHADRPGRDYHFSLDTDGMYLVSVIANGEKITRRVVVRK